MNEKLRCRTIKKKMEIKNMYLLVAPTTAFAGLALSTNRALSSEKEVCKSSIGNLGILIVDIITGIESDQPQIYFLHKILCLRNINVP